MVGLRKTSHFNSRDTNADRTRPFQLLSDSFSAIQIGLVKIRLLSVVVLLRPRTAFARRAPFFFAALDQPVPFHSGSGTPAV